MKKIMLMAALMAAMTQAHAQRVVEETDLKETEETVGQTETGDDGVKQSPSTGDLFDGLTRPITFDRMIPPYALEVTFYKTVHIIFPATIKYVDLGSADIIAGKADGSENVLRVKAALRDFSRETNLAVITEDGSYYTFNVKYADDKRLVKHIGCKRFGIQYLLKGIYTHNGLLYFHTELKNSSNVPFTVDFVSFKVVDRKVAKRTAIQEQVIVPLRAYNYVTEVGGKSRERTVFTLPKFTLPDDKQLVVEINEQNGGRHQQFTVTNAELVRARVINELKVK